jgi:hypothetical protein
MNVLLICVVIFILFMAAGFAGLSIQSRLTEGHKTAESKSVVGQVDSEATQRPPGRPFDLAIGAILSAPKADALMHTQPSP